MKKLVSNFLPFFLLFALPAEMFSQKISLGEFNALDVSDGIDIQLIIAKEDAIDIEVENLEPGNVSHEISGMTLKLRVKKGFKKNSRSRKNTKIDTKIHTFHRLW